MSMTMSERRKAIQRRWDRLEVAKMRVEEGREEERFEERLRVGGGRGVGRAAVPVAERWGEEWRTELRVLDGAFKREARRSLVSGRFKLQLSSLVVQRPLLMTLSFAVSQR